MPKISAYPDGGAPVNTDGFVIYRGSANRQILYSALVAQLDATYLLQSDNLADLPNAATARTNLGLVAGGAGDIWVEKAGDTMTGDLTFSGAFHPIVAPGSDTDAVLMEVTVTGTPQLSWDESEDMFSVSHGLDIVEGTHALLIGAENLANIRTDATQKVGRIALYHYTNAEEPVEILSAGSSSTENALNFGGSSGISNAATILRFYTAANTTTVVGTIRMVIGSTGTVLINDTANTKMTIGLTINQGANDDEIFALKSSDVAHGRTTLAETDTFAAFSKGSATGGGLKIMGISDADATTGNYSLQLLGYTADAALDTTKSTAGLAAVVIAAGITDGGTSVTTPGADENLLAIRAFETTRFIFDTEGSAHADVEWTTFDEYDDVAILKDLEATLVPDAFGAVISHGQDFFEKHGILNGVRVEDNGKTRGMLNQTRLLMLQTGAISQLASKLERYEKALLDAGIDIPRLEN